MVIKSVIYFIISASILFSSCKEDEGFGEYYEGNFNDLITIVNESDSANIVIEQTRILSFLKDNIPYSEEINSSNPDSDTINLKLFVSFGSYSRVPKVIKEINNILDTFYVWYSTKNNLSKAQSKNNSVTAAKVSPKLDYVSIDRIVVQRAQNKFIRLTSRIIDQ